MEYGLPLPLSRYMNPGLWTWQDVLESDYLKLSPVTAKQMWISDQVAGVEVDGLVAYYLIWQM